MATCLYRRTEAGRKAWETQDARVLMEYRRILGLVGIDTDPDQLRRRLGLSESALNEILDELEQQGMIQSIQSGPERTDLDFTGNFSTAGLQAGRKKD